MRKSNTRDTGRGVARHDALATADRDAGAVIIFANHGGREQAAQFVSEDGEHRVNVRLAGTSQIVSISRCQITLDGRTAGATVTHESNGAPVVEACETHADAVALAGTLADAGHVATISDGLADDWRDVRPVGVVTFARDNGQGWRDALAVVHARRVAKIGRTVHTDTRETRGDACALPVAVASRYGITARDAGARALADRDARARNVAFHVATLAGEFARAFQRLWESKGGKPFDDLKPNPMDEIEAIYRAAFLRAFVRSGVCPSSKHALYTARRARHHGAPNQLGFRALRAWHVCIAEATSQVRSYLWGKGAERWQKLLASEFDVREFARSFADASRVRFVGCDASGDNEHEGEALDADALGQIGSALNWHASPVAYRVAPVPVARLRREVRHARECLRAFWTVNESRKWRAGYVTDSRLLAAIVAVSRGQGVAALSGLGLLSEGGRYCSDALRQAVSRLRRRLRDGDKLITDKPEQCARALVQCFGARGARGLVADLLPTAKREHVATHLDADAQRAADFAALYGVAGC